MQSLYLVVLGAGIGMCMQVLVLIVQNTVDFSDLGVATSGVTFFRTIGSSFGAAVFGSLFNNFLHSRLADAIAKSGAPPEAAQSPDALHRLAPEVAAPIAAAYADALDLVFLCAAPVAVVGFVLALMLKQVPLRNNDVSIAADLGEGFAMPTTDSPDQLLENAVGRLIRQGSGMQLRALAERPGSKLDIGRLWALLQVFRFGQAAGQARLGDIAEHVRVPREILEPAFDRLAATGYAERGGDVFWLTPAGAHQVEVVRAETMEWLTRRLAQSAGLQVRPDQVGKAMDRISQNVLVQRDWTEDETQAMRMRPPRRAPQPPGAGPAADAAPAPLPPRPAAPDPRTRPHPRPRTHRATHHPHAAAVPPPGIRDRRSGSQVTHPFGGPLVERRFLDDSCRSGRTADSRSRGPRGSGGDQRLGRKPDRAPECAVGDQDQQPQRSAPITVGSKRTRLRPRLRVRRHRNRRQPARRHGSPGTDVGPHPWPGCTHRCRHEEGRGEGGAAAGDHRAATQAADRRSQTRPRATSSRQAARRQGYRPPLRRRQRLLPPRAG